MNNKATTLKNDDVPVWRCKCPCHKAGRLILHPVTCRVACPHCKKKIARGMLKEHLKDCKKYQQEG